MPIPEYLINRIVKASYPHPKTDVERYDRRTYESGLRDGIALAETAATKGFDIKLLVAEYERDSQADNLRHVLRRAGVEV